MHTTIRRHLAMAAAAVVASTSVAGCALVANSDPPDPVYGSDLGPAAAAITDTHGPVEGFSLIVLAIDQGYSTPQITANATSIEFRGYDERVLDEEPAGGAQGVLSAPDEVVAWAPAIGGFGMSRSARVETEPMPPTAAQFEASPGGQALGSIWAVTDMVIAAPAWPEENPEWEGLTEEEYAEKVRAQVVGASVLALAARGYSLEQIILGLMAGTIAGAMPPEYCTLILDEAPAIAGQDAMAQPDGECLPLEEELAGEPSLSPSPSESAVAGGGGGPASEPSEEPDADADGREVILRGPFPGGDVTLANNAGDVVSSQTTVVTVDGVVQSVDSVLEIENWRSSIEDGEVMCVSEGTLRISTTEPATASASVVDLPAVYTIESRNGTGPDCDLPDLRTEVTVRVTTEDDTVFVALRQQGASVGKVEVTR